MPRYPFACGEHGEFETFYTMDEPHASAPCPACRSMSPRIFTVPQVPRNRPLGQGYSITLGDTMPETQRDYYKRLESIGAEPVTPKTMPQQWKDNAAYLEHVRHGGERERKPSVADRAPIGTRVADQLRASQVKIA